MLFAIVSLFFVILAALFSTFLLYSQTATILSKINQNPQIKKTIKAKELLILNIDPKNYINHVKESLEQASINACESIKELRNRQNCQNPNDYYVAWNFLCSLLTQGSNPCISLTGSFASLANNPISTFSCQNAPNFGVYSLSSLTNLASGTFPYQNKICVYSCSYNLNINSLNNWLINTQPNSSLSSINTLNMADPCAVQDFVSCTYTCS